MNNKYWNNCNVIQLLKYHIDIDKIKFDNLLFDISSDKFIYGIFWNTNMTEPLFMIFNGFLNEDKKILKICDDQKLFSFTLVNCLMEEMHHEGFVKYNDELIPNTIYEQKLIPDVFKILIPDDYVFFTISRNKHKLLEVFFKQAEYRTRQWGIGTYQVKYEDIPKNLKKLKEIKKDLFKC